VIDSDKLTEETKSSKEIYNGDLLHVFRDEVTLPDGSNSVREWIKHPGATAIVPIFKNGDTMLIGQYRYPCKKVFYEVPAGKLDPGEDPLTTGKRELTEETGLVAKKWHEIGPFYPCIGYSDEVIYVYAATEIEETEINVDDDEFVEPFRLPFGKAIEMVHSGEISDGKTVISLLRTEHWLREK